MSPECSYGAAGKRGRTIRPRLGAVAVATALLALVLASSVSAGGVERLGLVSGCRPFTIGKGHDSLGNAFTFRAWSVKRATRLRCRMARRLLKAAYDGGPLRVIRRTYPFGHHSGRPVYWLRGGWRCSNSAGGASCFNAHRPIFNAIELEGSSHGSAVTASTG